MMIFVAGATMLAPANGPDRIQVDADSRGTFSSKGKNMRNALIGNLGARPPRVRSAAHIGLIACTTSALLSGWHERLGAQQQALRWKLKAGEVLSYKTEHESRLTVKLSGRERKQARSQTIYYHWTVTSVSDRGRRGDHPEDRPPDDACGRTPFDAVRCDSKAPPAEVPEVV